MRKEEYTGATDEDWETFCEDHATAEYGDPMMTLESLDKYLQKQGKEVVIVKCSTSDCFFRVEGMESEVTLTAVEASLVKLALKLWAHTNSQSLDGDNTTIIRGLMKKVD